MRLGPYVGTELLGIRQMDGLVTAPSDAEPTSAAYLAKAPVAAGRGLGALSRDVRSTATSIV